MLDSLDVFDEPHPASSTQTATLEIRRRMPGATRQVSDGVDETRVFFRSS